MATGAHPILPLDIQEATWLVETTRAHPINSRINWVSSQSLAKHRTHVEEMRKRIDQRKREWLLRYEKIIQHTIKDLNFQSGDLVLIRNTEIESSLNKKMKPRYMGPMIVISRSKGVHISLLKWTVLFYKIKSERFRVIPYFARHKIEFSRDILDLLDVSKEGLQKIEASEDEVD